MPTVTRSTGVRPPPTPETRTVSSTPPARPSSSDSFENVPTSLSGHSDRAHTDRQGSNTQRRGPGTSPLALRLGADGFLQVPAPTTAQVPSAGEAPVGEVSTGPAPVAATSSVSPLLDLLPILHEPIDPGAVRFTADAIRELEPLGLFQNPSALSTARYPVDLQTVTNVQQSMIGLFNFTGSEPRGMVDDANAAKRGDAAAAERLAGKLGSASLLGHLLPMQCLDDAALIAVVGTLRRVSDEAFAAFFTTLLKTAAREGDEKSGMALMLLGRLAILGSSTARASLHIIVSGANVDAARFAVGCLPHLPGPPRTNEVAALAHRALNLNDAAQTAALEAFAVLISNGNTDAIAAVQHALRAPAENVDDKRAFDRSVFMLAHVVLAKPFVTSEDIKAIENRVFADFQSGNVACGTVGADALKLLDELERSATPPPQVRQIRQGLIRATAVASEPHGIKALLQNAAHSYSAAMSDDVETLLKRHANRNTLTAVLVEELTKRTSSMPTLVYVAEFAGSLSTPELDRVRADFAGWQDAQNARQERASAAERANRVFNPNCRDFDWNNARLTAAFSKLAYETSEIEVKKIAQSWGFIDAAIYHDPTTDADAIAAVRDDHIIIAFRGSENPNQEGDGQLIGQDWWQNLDATMVQDSRYGGGYIHRGFRDQVEGVYRGLKTFIDANPGKPVMITGHSLGGAAAVLLASRLAREGIKVEGLYTFGQPKVGDGNFLSILNRDLGSAPFIRFRNNHDTVPTVPPFGDYTHGPDTFQAYWFDGEGRLRVGDEGKNAVVGSVSGGFSHHNIDHYQRLTDEHRNRVPRSR